MKYRITITTYDPELISALNAIEPGKRGKFIEAALAHFTMTRKGKKMIAEMTIRAKQLKNKTENKIHKKDTIDIDKFL